MSKEEADYLSEATVLQSETLLWYDHCQGRITASIFGSVYHTDLQSLSTSLLNSITVKSHVPEVAAIKWGREKEAATRERYGNEAKRKHDTFELKRTGLHVNPQFPHLGASPDGLISCSCCGKGLLEIKCPYSKRDQHPRRVPSNDANFYIMSSGAAIHLSHKHNSYFQVQGHMAICDPPYTDCVLDPQRNACGVHISG